MLDKIFIKIGSIKNKFCIDLKVKIFLKVKKNISIKNGVFNQNTVFYGPGKVEIDENFSLGFKYGGGFKGREIEIQARDKNAIIKIGKNVATNNGVFICAIKKIEIGNDVLIGSNVTIMDHNGHGISPGKRNGFPGTPADILIEDNVWLGNFVHILPGTKIGKNSVVGAGAIVKGEFPANCIIQGNPAKIIKFI
ncbi:MAG: acyltransferase [Cetobacterium sp.]